MFSDSVTRIAKRISILLATLSLMTFVEAKNTFVQRNNAIHFSKKDFVDTIPIQVINGAVIVPVEIEGQAKKMLFDTGCTLAIWVGQKESWMKEENSDSLSITDANNQIARKELYNIPSLKIGDLEIRDYPLITGEAMQSSVCDMFDGLLGFNLVNQGLSFKLDTQDSMLIVTDRKNFFAKESKGQATAKYRMTPGLCPLIQVKSPIGKINLLFDTGAHGMWFSLPQKELDAWFAPSSKEKKWLDKQTILSDTTINTRISVTGTLTDTLVGRFIHFPQIHIGDLPVNDLYTKTTVHNLSIGSGLLEQTSLIIDAHCKRLVFLPHNQQGITVGNNDAYIEFIHAEAGDSLGCCKAVVFKGSDAYQKGIRTGDYLLEINGTPITDVCSVVSFRTSNLHEALFKFRSPDGTLKEARLKR